MSDAPKSKPGGKRKLADNERTDRHVEALADQIMADPSFPLLHETARKLVEEEKAKEKPKK